MNVRFGVFELNLASGELRKSGVKIRLQEQPFQVLKALVERPGDVVSREELGQRLWPDETFVDFEDGLSTAVRKIRQALGDSAINPRFVETLPKRGYRFIAPVEGAATSAADPAERPSRAAWYVAAAALAIAIAAVAALWLTRSTESESAADPLPVPVPLTSYRGEEDAPSFSPDGGRVAFHWRDERGSDIYVKLIGGESRQRLTTHPSRDRSPAWSPDGTQIAFVRGNLGEPQSLS